MIYVNGNWFAPAPVYYRRTVLLAQSAPDIAPEQAADVEWMPLGVFAAMPEGAEDANLLVQIAVTNDGMLGGTVLNQANGESYPLEGMVDSQTQRAAWTFVDSRDQRITMETGIFNLTKAEATILTHFSPEQMEVWQLVRLDQPAETAPAPAEPAAPVDAAGVLPTPADAAP